MQSIRLAGLRQGHKGHFATGQPSQQPLWVKTRKAQSEHFWSAMPQKADLIGSFVGLKIERLFVPADDLSQSPTCGARLRHDVILVCCFEGCMPQQVFDSSHVYRVVD